MRAVARFGASHQGHAVRPALGCGRGRLLHRIAGRGFSHLGDSGVVFPVWTYVDRFLLYDGTAHRTLFQEQLQRGRGAAQPDLYKNQSHPHRRMGNPLSDYAHGRTSSCKRARPILSVQSIRSSPRSWAPSLHGSRRGIRAISHGDSGEAIETHRKNRGYGPRPWLLCPQIRRYEELYAKGA